MTHYSHLFQFIAGPKVSKHYICTCVPKLAMNNMAPTYSLSLTLLFFIVINENPLALTARGVIIKSPCYRVNR